MDTSPKSEIDERAAERATRRMRTLDEKLAILKEAAQPGASVALVARKHGMNANLLFGWRRLHRRGLLEEQRHGKSVPLLPVKITTPTLTPSDRTGGHVVRRRRNRTANGSRRVRDAREAVRSAEVSQQSQGRLRRNRSASAHDFIDRRSRSLLAP